MVAQKDEQSGVVADAKPIHRILSRDRALRERDRIGRRLPALTWLVALTVPARLLVYRHR
jgi:hypothetical protein